MGFELTTLVVIGTYFLSSYKSNYHMITTTTALEHDWWPYQDELFVYENLLKNQPM